MAAPTQAIPGCPPGLEYLTQVDQLLVNQQIEFLESMWYNKLCITHLCAPGAPCQYLNDALFHVLLHTGRNCCIAKTVCYVSIVCGFFTNGLICEEMHCYNAVV